MLSTRSVTHDMMKISLAYLMFLKRKRAGHIKDRGYANERTLRVYITKLKSGSPCAKTLALFLSCIVDAFENRYVIVVNIPAAFLPENWPENVPDTHIQF